MAKRHERRLFARFQYEDLGEGKHRITAKLPANYGLEHPIEYVLDYHLDPEVNRTNHVGNLGLNISGYQGEGVGSTDIVCDEEWTEMCYEVHSYFAYVRSFISAWRHEGPIIGKVSVEAPKFEAYLDFRSRLAQQAAAKAA